MRSLSGSRTLREELLSSWAPRGRISCATWSRLPSWLMALHCTPTAEQGLPVKQGIAGPRFASRASVMACPCLCASMPCPPRLDKTLLAANERAFGLCISAAKHGAAQGQTTGAQLPHLEEGGFQGSRLLGHDSHLRPIICTGHEPRSQGLRACLPPPCCHAWPQLSSSIQHPCPAHGMAAFCKQAGRMRRQG